jgi:hypothetical protein
MKKTLLILFFCAFFFSAAYSEIFRITAINEKPAEIKTYEKDSGKYVWHSKNFDTIYKTNGHTYLLITEDGEGQYGNDKQFKKWHEETVYLYENETIVPQNSILEFRNKAGDIIASTQTTYDQDKRKVYCKLLNDKKEFDLKDGILDKNGLGLALMSYPFDRKADFVFPMLTDEPAFYNMTLVNKGLEPVDVGGGKTIDCYKLQMIPDLGFLGIFAPFVPKTYFWYRAAPPHDFIRYEGLESGLNTPYIVMQAQQ